ncbi:hypothetical protein T439DRAFT_351155 [Meredithblackwellia eburnea MCA 4105]
MLTWCRQHREQQKRLVAQGSQPKNQWLDGLSKKELKETLLVSKLKASSDRLARICLNIHGLRLVTRSPPRSGTAFLCGSCFVAMDPQNMLWDGAQTAFYKDSCRAGLTVPCVLILPYLVLQRSRCQSSTGPLGMGAINSFESRCDVVLDKRVAV